MKRITGIFAALAMAFTFLLGATPAQADVNYEPYGLTQTQTTPSSFKLTWDQPTQPGIQRWVVYAEPQPVVGDPDVLVYSTSSATDTYWQPTGLPSGTAYDVVVKAVVNGVEQSGNYPYTVSTFGDTQVKNLQMQSVTISGGVLQWDNVTIEGPVDEYRIYKGTRQDGTGGWHHATSADNLQTIGGLTAGQCYLYSVAAVIDGSVQPRSAGFNICGGS